MSIQTAMLEQEISDLKMRLHGMKSLFVNLSERLNILLDEENWEGIEKEIRALREE